MKRKDRVHISLPNSSLWNVAEDFWRILQVASFYALYFHWHEKLKAPIMHESDSQTYERGSWISALKPVNHNVWGAGACLITQAPNWPPSKGSLCNKLRLLALIWRLALKEIPSPVKAAPLGGSRGINSAFHLILAAGEEVKVRRDLNLAHHLFFFFTFSACPAFLQAQISTIFQWWLLQNGTPLTGHLLFPSIVTQTKSALTIIKRKRKTSIC